MAQRTPIAGQKFEPGLRAQAARLEVWVERLSEVTTAETLERACLVCDLEKILSEYPGGQE